MKSSYRIAAHQRRQALKSKTEEPQAIKAEEVDLSLEMETVSEREKLESESTVGAELLEESKEFDFSPSHSPKEQKTKTEKKH